MEIQNKVLKVDIESIRYKLNTIAIIAKSNNNHTQLTRSHLIDIQIQNINQILDRLEIKY